MLLLPACGGGGDGGGSHSMVGAWQAVVINGTAVPTNTMVITFSADGTGVGTAAGETYAFTWSLTGNQLTMTSGGDTEVSTVTWLSSNRLQVNDPEGDVLIWQR